MSRQYPVTGVRMPPELKDRLQNAADLNGRSLNMEIVHRLLASLESAYPPAANEANAPMAVNAPVREYTVPLTDLEKSLLAVFRRLPVEKQLALISLFK
jgi:hypothetical protein